MSLRNMFYATALIFGAGFGAQAAPIYNSINSTNAGVSIGGNTFADSFTTSSSGIVDDIAIALTKTSSASGSVVITLWSDNGVGLSTVGTDAPGTLVATIGTVSASSLTVGTTTIEFFTPSLTLSANTEYWIEIGKAAGPTSTINFELNSTAPTIGGTSDGLPEIYRAAGVNNTAPPEMELCVSGDHSCAATVATPEPSAFSILGISIAGLGFALHRRRRSARAA